ncbi:MAG TPA: hypothetical protein VF762_15925 [Blastocatellia bacterium]|jgi:hypothetical protein
MAKGIDSHKFLAGESWSILVDHALSFQRRMVIVKATDPDKEL